MADIVYDRLRTQKVLGKRTERTVAMVRYEQAGMLGASLSQLRTITAGLVRDFRGASEWSARCTIARTVCQVIEQRRVLLRLPGPGRDVGKPGGGNGARLIDVTEPPADPVDAEILRELEERAKERAKGQAAPAETEPTAP